MKVLIIEDELELAKSIKNYLTTNTFVCDVVSGFYAAKESISKNKYD